MCSLVLRHKRPLNIETGRVFDLDAEIHELAQHLDKFYALLRLEKMELLKEEYMKQLLGHHHSIIVKKGNTEIEVTVKDIKESGKIVLEEKSGDRWVAGFKEFEWTY